MKHFSCLLVAMLVGSTVLGVLSAQAQAPAAAVVPADRALSIKKVDAGKVKTPDYQVKHVNSQARSLDWYKIEVIYDTEPEWMDEVSFTYYVVVKAKQSIPGRPPFMLFKGDVTYVNVAKGRHKSDIYLHPSTLARFGDVERVAALVNVGGRLVAIDGLPSGSASSRWWEQLPPQDGYLLNRMQTPFAMINFDDYEAVKPKN